MAADNTEDNLSDIEPQSHQQTTSTPSSPDAAESSNQRLSRKRERTVSLEPSTPKADDDDAIGQFLNNPSHRSPKKKNRIRLESTEEEDGTSRSRTPSPSSSRPSPPHEVKVRQISQGVEDINWRQREMAAAAAAAENNNAIESDVLVFDPATPIAISDKVPTAPASPADVDAAAVSPEYNVEKLQARSTSPRSGSDSGDPDKSLKRKLADRGTSHGPENGDAVKATDDSETLKHARDEDDNPRAKKRPTPPRTPEPINALDGQKRPTPPATPPSDSDDLSKLAEPSTRPRDDSDKDANPRQTKKPSPPPEQTPREEPRTTTPKLGGFMAYAATSSPFASVKGQNIFGGSSKLASFSKGPSPSPSPSPANSQISRFPTIPVVASPLGESSTPVPTATKRTGFEAFAGSTSPFASAARSKSPNSLSSNVLRSKSPGRRVGAASSKSTSAFTSYAIGGAQGFAVPVSKRARAETPDGESSSLPFGSLERNSTLSVLENEEDEDEVDRRRDEGQLTFGEKLRAGKDANDNPSDEEAKPELTEQAVHTGEEDENIMYMVRAKIFRLSEQNQWKERGTGTLKLNVRKTDGEGARLVMRKEAVFTVLLNVTLFHGMSVSATQDPRYVRISVIEGGKTVHYNIRVPSAKIGEELLDAIKAYIPPPPSV